MSFRAFVNHVILDRTLTRDAAADAALVMSALHEGRVFTSIDGIAGLTAFEAIASSGSVVARPGEYITSPGPVAISARIAAPPGTRLSVVRNGVTQFEVAAPAMRVDVGREPGAYRVEAHLPAHMTSSNIPWVLSNPIYVGLIGEHERAARRSVPPVSHRTAIETWLWRAEASDGSSSALDVVARMEDGTPALEWNYALAGGPKAEQYAAIRFPVEQGLQGQDRLQLRVRGDGPKRIWAQVRAPGPAGGERWGRTFYIDKSLAHGRSPLRRLPPARTGELRASTARPRRLPPARRRHAQQRSRGQRAASGLLISGWHSRTRALARAGLDAFRVGGTALRRRHALRACGSCRPHGRHLAA